MNWNKLPLLLLLPLLISACDSQQPTYSASNANSAPPPQPAPVAEAPKPAEPPVQPRVETAPAKKPAVAATHEPVRARPMASRPDPLPPVSPFGIGSCDDYINRYRACVNTGMANDTIPERSLPRLVRGLNVQVRQWQADVAAGKATGLVTACAEADQKARPELVKVGCTSF